LRKPNKQVRQLLQNIIEFVSQPLPGNWIEDDEWWHDHEY